jgi:CheY-like chemotaxis protein/PAS domain-containing protein
MAGTDVRSLHVLVVGTMDCAHELDQWVDEHARVDHVATFQTAIDAMRSEPYDIIISSAAEFIPFREFHFTEQASAILDSVDQGVCIVGEGGSLVWANPRMLAFPPDVRDRVSRCCMETFNWARTESGAQSARGRRFTIALSNGQHLEVTATPVIDLNNRVTQVASVVRDATRSKRLQEKIDAIDKAGRELVRLDAEQFAKLDVQERLALLEQRILHCTRNVLNFDNFAIFVLDERTQMLNMVLQSGMPASALQTEVYASIDERNGITGWVAAKGRSYCCADVASDSRYLPGIDGARSALAVPLQLSDRIIGVANFESTKPAAFNEDDRQFAEIFGRYVAIALQILELLVSEHRTAAGRLGSDVMAEITGPVNDILTDVEGLVEDYIGHDDLRHRLRRISESAVRIRDSIRQLTAERPGMVGVRTTSHVRHDPMLTGKRILVADDEDIIRETVRDVLVGYGCQVAAVSEGAAAIEKITNEPPFDLVLSDIKMPGKNGYDVFAAAKLADPNTPVILMTGFGYDPNHAIVRARREGLAAVLFKPFKVDQLLSELKQALKPAS